MAPLPQARVVRLLAAAAASAAAAAATCTARLGAEWSLCQGPQGRDGCIPAPAVPGTAFVNMLAAGTWPGLTDPWVDALLNTTVPDISVTGPAFWTWNWTTSVVVEEEGGGSGPGASSCAGAVLLTLPQISYRAAVFLDGVPVPLLTNASGGGGGGAAGMFARHRFLLGDAGSLGGAVHVLSVQVAPPDYPGNTSSTCHVCGQGGNHEIAKNVASQDTAGWDWIAGVPDRNTGLLDTPEVALLPPATSGGGAVLLGDPVASVVGMQLPPPGPDGVAPRSATAVSLAVRVGALLVAPPPGGGAVTGTLTLTLPSLQPAGGGGGGLVATAPLTLAAGDAGGWVDVDFPLLSAVDVPLWWPHTLGAPTLHNATVAFTPAGAPPGSPPPAAVAWRVGVRTVSSEVDPALGGRVFRVNGHRVFLQGGNFINPDMFARGRGPGSTRYADEVALHAAAGLNLLRLWGGSGGHPPALYAAADEVGVLVLVEFWMAGDCNGRWAGSYEWPLDHRLYLAAAADTVRAVRGRACVLLFCGGNELYPLDQSPPPDIAAALPALVAGAFPPAAPPPPYVQSSMGSTYGVDTPPAFDPVRTLAPLDGPYGILDERLFAQRNPGLFYGSPPVRADAVPIAFQPELGSVSCPEADSLARFLTPPALEAVPPRNATGGAQVHPAWTFHAYLPFTDGGGWDHVYAYGAPPNASEYALRAQLAQLTQARALLEGFQGGIFTWYGGVAIWKTQSPWPAFRGALYDSWLAPTGGLWGARAATAGGAPLRAQVDMGSYGVLLVNKGIDRAPLGGLVVGVQCWDIARGLLLEACSGATPPLAGWAEPGTATRLPLALAWPGAGAGVPPGATLLYRLTATPPPPPGGGNATATAVVGGDYWFANLSNDTAVPQDFAPGLGRLREEGPYVALAASAAGAPRAGDGALVVTLTLACPPGAPAVAFAVRATLRRPGHGVVAATGAVDDRVLPSWASDNYFALVPGEARTVQVVVPGWRGEGGLVARVDGWNVAPVDVPVVLPPPERAGDA